MPFGLNITPRIFTKVCKPILSELRRRGIKLVVYLDDWLVWGHSLEECFRATETVLQVLQKEAS